MQYIRYALAELEETFDAQLLSNNHSTLPASNSADGQKLISSISSAAQSAKREMLKDIIGLSNSDSAKLYVETHLSSLSSMLNVLHSRHLTVQPKKGTANGVGPQLLIELGTILEEIIEFIRIRFENHFPSSLIVPFTRIARERDKLGDLLHSIASNKADGIDPSLITIIETTITSQLNEGSTTFRQLEYFRDLLTAILSKPATADDAIIHFHKKLTEYNFNESSYIDYCTHALVNNCLHPSAQQFVPDTPEKKIGKYYWYLKMIRQVPERKDAALHPGVNSVAQQMTNWIEQEVKFFETINTATQGQAAGQKVHTDVSVGILAIMLRLAVEGGLVKNVTTTDFVKAVAQFFTTSGTDNISFASLHSKYYNPEKASIHKVKEIYHKFIQILNGWLSDPPKS